MRKREPAWGAFPGGRGPQTPRRPLWDQEGCRINGLSQVAHSTVIPPWRSRQAMEVAPARHAEPPAPCAMVSGLDRAGVGGRITKRRELGEGICFCRRQGQARRVPSPKLAGWACAMPGYHGAKIANIDRRFEVWAIAPGMALSMLALPTTVRLPYLPTMATVPS